MKALTQTNYGPPEALQLVDKEIPSPQSNEVLIKVQAASVNAMEWRIFTFPKPFRRLLGGGFSQPKNTVCGSDVAGRIEAVGSAVTQFRVGDAVFGAQRGAFAEYVCATEDKLALKPANVSFEAAAAVPIAGLTALQAIRDQARAEPGHTVLINGAGGGVGTFAVQIAKAFGAEVTAVCGPRTQNVARSIGADHVIDYTREDFTKNGRRYDAIIAANGYHSIFDYRRSLAPNGVYVVLGGAMAQMFQAMLLGAVLSRLDKRRFRGLMARANHEDLLALGELLSSGKVVPAIDRRYPLTEVGAAMRYLIEGHASGKVVIAVGEESRAA